jgi:Fe2+ transport system protein FeoA
MILNSDSQTLGMLHPGDAAEITGFSESKELESFLYRLYEVGFLIGEKLEVLNHAPVSKCPISIKIKDATYAIRREDANLIQVRKISKP